MNLTVPLLLLLLSSKKSGGSPSTIQLGTAGIVRPANKPPIPVKLEMIQRGSKNEVAWVVQNLGSLNLDTARAALKASVGKVLTVDVSTKLQPKARWDGNVFVPV